jgi:hypothetical protein
VALQDARPPARGQRREGARALHGIGLGAERRVHRAQQRGREAGLERAHLARGDQLHALAAGLHLRHARAGELVLLGRVDGLERAGAAKLHVLALVELHALEDLHAARGEMVVEIAPVAPAHAVDEPGVQAGGGAGDLAALHEGDVPAEPGQVIGGGGAGDPASDDEHFRPAGRPRRHPWRGR